MSKMSQNITNSNNISAESPLKLYKNFTEMCKDLEGEVYEGKSKVAFLKYLNEFLDYSKLGRSYIYAIYSIKKPYTQYKDRDKIVIREAKWNNSIARVLLHELFTTFTGDNERSILSDTKELVLYSKDLYNMVGLCSAKLFNLREHGYNLDSSDEAFQKVFLDYCRVVREDNKMELSSLPKEEAEILYKNVVDWFHSTTNTFSDITTRVLEELHKRNIIFYEKTYVILRDNEPKLRLCSRREHKDIHLAKGSINMAFSLKHEGEAIRKGIGKKYYSMLAKLLRDKYGILVSYSVHRISFGENSSEMLRRFMLTDAEKLGFVKDTNEKSIDTLLQKNMEGKTLVDMLIPVSL